MTIIEPSRNIAVLRTCDVKLPPAKPGAYLAELAARY